MKFFALLGLFLAITQPAWAQQAILPCVPTTANPTPCTPITITNPLPTTPQ